MEQMKPKIEIIILQESIAQSFIRDFGSFMTFALLIGLGWLIGSFVMEWVGAILGMFSLGGRIVRLGKHRMSIDAARARLDELEAGKE